jgi:hypothetical protein
MLMTEVPTYGKNLADIVAIHGRDRELFRPPTYITIFFSESLTSKNVLSKSVTLAQYLMFHESLQYLLGEEQLGETCFMHVSANVPDFFTSDSIQVLA